MSSLQYLEVVFCFLSLTELTRFSAEFCVVKFSSFGWKIWWIMEQGLARAKAWGCPGRHPLFRLLPSVTLLGAIFLFTTWYVFCLERLVWFESLLFSLPQSSLLYTPFERDTHDSEFIRILYVLHLYLLSYIVFAPVLHLYLLEHGGGFVL